MNRYVALLRAVNVGGTGRLPMAELVRLCGAAGVRTYVASGNVVFGADGTEDEVRLALRRRLLAHGGTEVDVVVRTAAEIGAVPARNPFPNAPASRVAVLFTDEPLPADPLQGATGVRNERVRLGRRELFVLYPDGIGATRLRIPAERFGTARNMNTVARLADMAADGGDG